MPRHSTKRHPEPNPPKSLPESRSLSSNVGPSPYRRCLTLCFLPVWFAVIIVFERAIADFNERALPITVHVDPGKLNQPQDNDQNQEIKRTFYVDPDENGNVNGRISTIELSGISPIEQQLKVVMLQHGEEKAKTETMLGADAGRFQLENVPTGKTGETYTLVAFGQNGFLAYAVHVRPPATNIKLQDQFQIEAAAIPPRFQELQRIVSRVPQFNDLVTNEEPEGPKPLKEELDVKGSFVFPLDGDSFSGKVLLPSGDNETRDLSNLNVFLIQNDKNQGQDSVGENGEFQINGVAAGIYGLVVAGKDGFAALSIKLVESGNAAIPKPKRTDEHYVSLPKTQALPSFNIPIITDPKDIEYCRKTINDLNKWEGNPVANYAQEMDEGVFGAPATGGVASTTTGAGEGSGGFPGGGRETFLRRAAVIAGIVAISLSDNDGGTTPTDMSPADP